MPDTPILSISVGEPREMHFDRRSDDDPKAYTFAFAQVLNPGDLAIISAADNVAYRHAIVPISEERILNRDPNAAIKPRISIVFRDIATLVPLAKARKNAAKAIKEREQRQQRKRERKVAKDAENTNKAAENEQSKKRRDEPNAQ